MMKKIIGVIVVAVLGLSLVACNESTTTSTSNNEGTSDYNSGSNTVTNETSTSSNDETSDYNSEEETVAEESNTSSNWEIFNEPFDTSPTIEETVLWDENDYKITATSLTYDSSYVFLNLTFENKCDQTLTFFDGTWYYDWGAVNGYMLEGSYVSEEVAPGESVDSYLTIYMSTLESFGIKEIADIRFGLAIEKEDGDLYDIPPAQIKTSAYDSYDYNTDTFADLVNKGQFGRVTDFDVTFSAFDTLYSKNDISMVAEVLAYPQDEEYNDGYPMFYFEMDNQSEYNIFVQISNIKVNDVMVKDHTWDAFAMYPDSRLVQSIDFDTLVWAEDEEVINELNLDAGVNNLTFDITIENENGEEALSPETVTINFK